MSLWKVKFDHKNGETRECKDCKQTFHAHKAVWRCRLCQNEKQRVVEQNKRSQYGKKDIYPFSSVGTEASLRFTKIRQKMRKAWEDGREALTEHYTAQLKEAEELGILQWIYDRRDKETAEANKKKTRSQTIKEYPDTRNYYED